MKGISKNKKKIKSFDIRKTCEIRANIAEKAKPSAHAEEAFRREPYYLRGRKNEKKPHKETDADGKKEWL